MKNDECAKRFGDRWLEFRLTGDADIGNGSANAICVDDVKAKRVIQPLSVTTTKAR